MLVVKRSLFLSFQSSLYYNSRNKSGHLVTFFSILILSCAHFPDQSLTLAIIIAAYK